MIAQPKPYFVVGGVDVVESETANYGGPLGVKQDQKSGQAICGFDGVVVE
jgi:hypothetical protein